MNRKRNLLDVAFLVLLLALVWILTLPRIGQTTFLADQLDQILNFYELLKLRPAAFYGGYMSGTNPQVHALGPVAAVAFGLPTWLGADPDGLHAVFILFLGLSLAFFCDSVSFVDRTMARLWTAGMLLVPFFWWHFSLIWACVLPMAFCFWALGFFCRFTATRQPGYAFLTIGALITALDVHLVTSVAWPIGAVTLLLLLARTPALRQPWSRGTKLALAVATIPILPYIAGEALTRFSNLRAGILHVRSSNGALDHAAGAGAARESFNIALDPFGWTAGAANVLFAAFVIYGLARVALKLRKRVALDGIDWLWLIYPVCILGQSAFYHAMNRPLLGPHYTAYLTPLYVFPVAAIARDLVVAATRARAPTVAFALALVAALLAPSVSRQRFDTSGWNFHAILATLSAVCQEHPRIATMEAGEFTAYTEGYETLFGYLIRRYPTGCTLADDAEVVLKPSVRNEFPPAMTGAHAMPLRLVRVATPGIGIYERAP